MDLAAFKSIWLVDFEYQSVAGERPVPHCMVAREFRSGQLLRLWADELQQLDAAPYPVDASALFVAYYSPAEFGCHLALGRRVCLFAA